MDIAEALQNLKEKFTSANQWSVERATITREEYEAIYKAIYNVVHNLDINKMLAEIMTELEKGIIQTEGKSYLLDFYDVQRKLVRYFNEK